jgi:D-alanyl-D-alanine carboxypeptidase
MSGLAANQTRRRWRIRPPPDDAAIVAWERLGGPENDKEAMMHRTSRRLACLVSLALAAAAGAAPVADAAPKRNRLQRAADALVAAGAPGTIVLVRDGDRTTRVVAGYANLATKRPMRARDRFRVGSTTKTFVSAVVLQLAGEGKLALADSVERWLPGLVPNGAAITVHQLLNHTSGLADYAPDDDVTFISRVLAEPHRTWEPRELVAVGTAHQPIFAPGAGWSYSNTGYILLGLIAEAASGKPLEAELRARVLAPLGLRATSFDTGPRIAGPHAHGYSRFGAQRRFDISVLDQSWAWAAGAVVSTADDLARFYRALLGGRLLSPRLLAEMRTTVPVDGGQQAYGLGLTKSRYPCGTFWGHGGETFGYESFADSSADGKRQIMMAVTADQSLLGARAQRALDRVRSIAYCG